VVAINPARREVVIGSAEELAGRRVELEEVNWLTDPLEPGDRCEVQVRYRARATPATVVEQSSARLVLALETPVRAITPGQSGVLYNESGRLLGGGVIG
jgi:tRNA-specific 2-thiouridylase